MPYLFNDNFFLEMQHAFASAAIQSDFFEHSDLEKRDYFLVQFTEKPIVIFDKKNTVNIISKGDKEITDCCNLELAGLAKVELGLRWSGVLQETNKIIFLAFCIKIIYTDNKEKLQNRVIEKLCCFLKKQRLVDVNYDLHQQFVLPVPAKKSNYHQFFNFSVPPKIPSALLDSVKDYIKTYISPVLPAYIRQNESAMNPAYQDITATRDKLFLNEKKIWLFRSDMIVAVGNKNAYWINFAENGLADAIDTKLHRYINWEDRYGHPSLAFEYPGYRSGAFYAGLLAQRNGHLEIFTSSGRYFRTDLDEKSKKMIEAYLAYVFQQTYGKQPVIFVDSPCSDDYFECSLFYNDQALPEYCSKRKYDAEDIERIFADISTMIIHERLTEVSEARA